MSAIHYQRMKKVLWVLFFVSVIYELSALYILVNSKSSIQQIRDVSCINNLSNETLASIDSQVANCVAQKPKAIFIRIEPDYLVWVRSGKK